MKLIPIRPNFSTEILISKCEKIPLKQKDLDVIEKKIPYSLKRGRSFNTQTGEVTFISKKISCGHNSVTVYRQGNYLVFKKEYSTNNNFDNEYYEIKE